MPKGLKRYYGYGHLHFLTFSCHRRLPLLGTARARDAFVRTLHEVRRKYDFALVGYVVMPEHVHLLISEPKQDDPSGVIHSLKLRLSKRMRRSDGPAPAGQRSPAFGGAAMPRFWQPLDKSEGVVKRQLSAAVLFRTASISEWWRTEALKLSR